MVEVSDSPIFATSRFFGPDLLDGERRRIRTEPARLREI
jgi:hypothetical protein